MIWGLVIALFGVCLYLFHAVAQLTQAVGSMLEIDAVRRDSVYQLRSIAESHTRTIAGLCDACADDSAQIRTTLEHVTRQVNAHHEQLLAMTGERRTDLIN